MLNLTALTWIRFLIWMAIGVVVYFLYGRRHSALAQRAAAADSDALIHRERRKARPIRG